MLTTSTGPVAIGDDLSTVGSTTFEFGYNDGITLTCGKVGVVTQAASNPTSPGSATLKILQLGVSGCTLTGTPYTLQSITLSGTGVAVVSDGSPLQLTITSINVAIGLSTGLGTFACDFGATSATSPIVGIIVNPGPGGTGGSITFTNQAVQLISGTAYCGSSGLFNGTFTTPLDGSLPVTVN